MFNTKHSISTQLSHRGHPEDVVCGRPGVVGLNRAEISPRDAQMTNIFQKKDYPRYIEQLAITVGSRVVRDR